MAKVLCSISGVQFSCDYLPISLSSREYSHPIFHTPQKKLLGLYQKYRHGELESIDSYLLFLAFLNSTDLIEWRVPAKITPKTSQIIANNMDDLVFAVTKMNCIKNPSVHFSHIAISPDTCTLDNVHYWIASWIDTYEEFTSGYAKAKYNASLHELEEKLEYLIKDANRNEVKFATRLAEWADKAGAFPTFTILYQSHPIKLSEYWKLIIRKCTNQESIFQIPSKDLDELIDHCEDNIDAGSIYGHALFKILKEGRERQHSFLGLGPVSFSIISSSSSTEEENKAAIIASAPTDEPKRIDYPSTFQYLKAKLAWDMAQNQQSQGN